MNRELRQPEHEREDAMSWLLCTLPQFEEQRHRVLRIAKIGGREMLTARRVKEFLDAFGCCEVIGKLQCIQERIGELVAL